MKELWCRGKATDFDPRKQGQWVEGYYTLYPQGNGLHPCILTGTEQGAVIPVFVEPETVGRFTGLSDKTGKPIAEDDIVTFRTTAHSFKNCRIEYRVCYARYCAIGPSGNPYPMDETFEYEIIGNIHDNPELLG